MMKMSWIDQSRRRQVEAGSFGTRRAVRASLIVTGIAAALSGGTSCSNGEPPQDPLRVPWEASMLPDRDDRDAAPPARLPAQQRTAATTTAAAAADPAKVRAACLADGCHGELATAAGIHDRVVASSCERCHVPAGAPPEHTFSLSESSGGVCRTCHPSRSSRPLVHAPFQKGQCLACHKVHGSHAKLGQNAGVDGDTCRQCHESRKYKFMHGPYARGECLECHDPHDSDHEALLRATSGSLCVSCHERSIESSDKSRIVSAVGARVRSSAHLHGPVRDGACNVCHRAHGSEHSYLLDATFRSEFYQPFDEESYALCFQCHDRALVVEESTSRATNFRDGNRNLHHVHVYQEKGRSCRACHDAHASNQPFHIRETVPFGKWMLPVAFQRTSSGGTCSSGCHDTVSYNR